MSRLAVSHPDDAQAEVAAIVAATRRWLDLAVIGLNLCPFAYPVAKAGRIRYVVSTATSKKRLRAELAVELQRLAQAPADEVETSLLIHPWVLQDFYAFNDFLAEADAVLEDLSFGGVLQIASFHPHYQFADTDFDDIANATNRAPYPTLHLLREASIERAVKALPDPADIYERNIETMRRIGSDGWSRLQQAIEDGSPHDAAAPGESAHPAADAPNARARETE